MRKVKVGIVQQQISNDVQENMNLLKKNIEQCSAQGAELVVLQELHNTLYFFHT